MQSLTDRRKDKQICMHDREPEIGRQMEGGKDRSKFTDITAVGLCRRACVGSRCECRAGGRAEDDAVTYRNLEYSESQLCRNWAKR